MIVQAVRFACKAHAGQVRKYSVVPYITHPIRVMARAMVLNDSEDVHCAAVLHDVIEMEECEVDLEEIEAAFPQKIACLVWELTNTSDLCANANRATRKAMDRKRIASASPEAKLLKLIDRIDNLRELPDGKEFKAVYRRESLLLLNEALRGTHAELERELETLCKEIV